MSGTDKRHAGSDVSEVHIQALNPPYPGEWRYVILDGNRKVLLEASTSNGDTERLREMLQHLKEKDIMPRKIYIPVFSGVQEIVQSVWEDTKVFMEYD